MKVWQRLISLLNGIILLGLGVVLILLLMNKDIDLQEKWLKLNHWWQLGLTLTTYILCFFSIYMAIHIRREEKTIINQTQFGEIRIAVSAIESLAFRAAKRIKGVKDAHVGVRADLTGMDIFIEVTVNPDIGIPQISEEIRAKVDEYIYETVGIRVNSVKVLVAKVASEVRARVE